MWKETRTKFPPSLIWVVFCEFKLRIEIEQNLTNKAAFKINFPFVGGSFIHSLQFFFPHTQQKKERRPTLVCLKTPCCEPIGNTKNSFCSFFFLFDDFIVCPHSSFFSVRRWWAQCPEGGNRVGRVNKKINISEKQIMSKNMIRSVVSVVVVLL